jgi:hypothetical protein
MNSCHYDKTLAVLSIKTLGSLFGGCPETTHKVILFGALDVFKRLIMSPFEFVRQEACWVLSNIVQKSQLDATYTVDFIPILVLQVEQRKDNS